MLKKGAVKLKLYHVETSYLGEQADLKRIQENIKKYKYINRVDHPLIFELSRDEYAVVTKFGTVTFWNVAEGLAEEFVKEIDRFVKKSHQSYAFHDSIEVYTGAKAEKVTFEEIYLKKLDKERIKIISYVSAQSVAMDRYERSIDERLHELGAVVENLKESGRTRFSQKSLLKQVGNVLSVKQSIVSRLALVDKPEETWENEDIEKLYNRLKVEYELGERFEILNDKIAFLSENNTALLNFISMQKGNFLELIIIILIVIEIVIFVPDFLPPFINLFRGM